MPSSLSGSEVRLGTGRAGSDGREGLRGAGDRVVGGRQRDPDVPGTGRTVEVARGDEDAAVGAGGHGLPAALAAGRPEVEPGLAVLDREARTEQGVAQERPPRAVALPLLRDVRVVAE